MPGYSLDKLRNKSRRGKAQQVLLRLELPGQPSKPAEVVQTGNDQEILVIILHPPPVDTRQETKALQVRQRVLDADAQAAQDSVVDLAKGGKAALALSSDGLASG